MTFERAASFEALGIEHGFGGAGTLAAAKFACDRPVQVHGTSLARAPFELAPEADAVWTAAPGVAVAVVTADCVPILLCEPRGRFVCAIHAGWRGSAARIAAKTVRALVEATRIAPGEMIAAIGPHIGPCCYEVDAPVLEAIPERSVFSPAKRPEHAMLDLFALNRLRLVGAGVSARAIERVGGCTLCDPAHRYASYRRDKSKGQMLHFIRMRA